ncbi:protein CASC1-like [Cimex lectularius]|uniref:Axonemal 84 kDa protein n=1 Tax=Cimex lectularius TaxID=79782 RepID=A0A8I6TE34_CIMLE|nr:protein CASC1-like [Cimex lectularius]
MADIVSKRESISEPVRRMRKKAKGKEASKENEIKSNKERQKREESERRKREMLLSAITMLFKKVKAKGIRDIHKDEEIKEWKRYTSYNRLPYPEVPTSVRKHFLIWCQEKKFADLEEINKSVNLYIPIFNIVKQIADIPLKAYTNIIKSIQEIVVEWKSEFIKKIDYACFLLIKDIRKYFSHLDFYTKEYHKTFEHFKLGMWSLLDVPMRSDIIRELPIITFPSMEITVSLPFPYNSKPFVLRVIYTTFDFFSDLTKTSHKPDFTKAPDLLSETKRYEELKEAVQTELNELQKEKLRLLKLEKQKTEKDDAAEMYSPQLEIQEDISKNQEDNERKLSRRSTTTSLVSSVSQGPERANSANSQFSIISAQNKSLSGLVINTKSDSKTSFPFLDIKKSLPIWEAKSSDSEAGGQSRYSINTFSSKIRTSNVYTGDNYYDDKVNRNVIRWSCPDLDLLVARDSEMDVAKSFSFLDLIFYLYDNETLGLFNSEKTIQELVRQNHLQKKEKIDVNQEIKPMYEIISKREEERYYQFVEQMTIKTEPYEVNLRKCHTFSGIYCVDLFKHTSDLCRIQIGNFLQTQIGPYQLEKDDFCIQTKKPTSDSSIDNFEIKFEDYYFHLEEIQEIEQPIEEDEMDLNEAEIRNEEKLIVIKIYLPRNVFWFMKPQPAVWDNEKKIWSVEHVHKVEHNRQNFMIQFKLGKVGPIAMFTFRFHELPYKNWTLSPQDEDGTVVLTLEGQHLTVEFKVIQDKICLNNIMGYSQHLLEGIIGKLVSISELMDKMKSMGLDVFPEDDTFLYVKGCSAKPSALEDHIYFTMSMFSNTLQFTSSSWNLAIGRNDIAFQSRLHAPYSLLSYATYKANIFRCEMVIINDDAQKFPETTNQGKEFFPDSYSLLSKLYAKNVHFLQSDSTMVYTVYTLLTRTKVLTFSGDPSKCL